MSRPRSSRQTTIVNALARLQPSDLNQLASAKPGAIQEDAEAREEKKADLGATFVKFGSSNYRLKIWNKGKSAAKNVRIEFPSGNDVVSQSDLERKFPLEALEPFQSVELIAAVHMDTKSKHEVKLLWEDGHSAANEKTTYPTL